MSDLDPVSLDVLDKEENLAWGVDSDTVPKIVANELRRIYEKYDDPSLYFLIVRAQEIEKL